MKGIFYLKYYELQQRKRTERHSRKDLEEIEKFLES